MKVAVIATAWFPLSHADVIVTRWMKPFPSDATHGWTGSQSAISCAYIEQRPANDIGVKFCARTGIPVFDSVEQALTLGTGQLAVDAVLLIGEHGDFPRNEFGQKLYPRKRLFDDIVRVFRSSKRAVPVFNDKHFSWDFAESCQMMHVSRELGFPLYGGSSLPHCPCDPPVPAAMAEGIQEALALFHGDTESYGFHSLEFVQAFLEKRGETGIRTIRSLKGTAVQRAVANGDIPRDLLMDALVRHGYPQDGAIIPFVMERVENPVLFQIVHQDGLKVSHLLLPKLVSNWVASFRLGTGKILSVQADAGRGGCDFFPNFARLCVHLEKFFQTGKPPSSPLRTHLMTGALQAALQALAQNNCRVETPQLAITYQ